MQSSAQLKLSTFIEQIQSPEDLNMLQIGNLPGQEYSNDGLVGNGPRGKGWLAGYNRKYDADGDGVEDNEAWANDFSRLDKFYIPAVFGDAEEMYNTHHGNLPGHRQKEHDIIQSAYPDTYSVVPQSAARDDPFMYALGANN